MEKWTPTQHVGVHSANPSCRKILLKNPGDETSQIADGERAQKIGEGNAVNIHRFVAIVSDIPQDERQGARRTPKHRLSC